MPFSLLLFPYLCLGHSATLGSDAQQNSTPNRGQWPCPPKPGTAAQINGLVRPQTDNTLHLLARCGDKTLIASYLQSICEAQLSNSSQCSQVLERREPGTQWTTLHVAVRYHNEAAVRALLARGADVHARGLFFERIVFSRRLNQSTTGVPTPPAQILDGYMTSEDDCDCASKTVPTPLSYTPLHVAASTNASSTIVALLIAGGADVDARSEFHHPTDASESGAEQISAAYTPLLVALAKGNIAVANTLLDAGADVRARNWLQVTPLYYASERGLSTMVERLLHTGLVDLEGKANYEDDPPGLRPSLTPLHIAAIMGHTQVGRLLLGAGADVDPGRRFWGGNRTHHFTRCSSAGNGLQTRRAGWGRQVQAQSVEEDLSYDQAGLSPPRSRGAVGRRPG